MALVGVVVVGVVAWIPPNRSWLLRSIGRWEALNDDSRSWLLAKSVAAGDEVAVEDVCEIMLEDSERVFSMLVLESLWDERLKRVHEALVAWLDDESIAWPTDARQIRRCDLATYYFRIYVGERRWDTVKSLKPDVSDRDEFRERVRSFIREHGLPRGT